MLLLDTCTLLWLVDDQPRLSSSAKDLLRQNAGSLYVSAISAFEIGQKCVTGRLKLPRPPAEWLALALQLHALLEVPVTSAVAIASTELPRLHRDPCDRIIIATAQRDSLEIVTPDKLISAYPGVRVVW